MTDPDDTEPLDAERIDNEDAAPRRRSVDSTEWFAIGGSALAVLAFVVMLVAAFAAGGSAAAPDGSSADQPSRGDDGAVADAGADPAVVIAAAAVAMGAVESVEFFLERDGAPVFIDEFESIELDRLRGQFAVPDRAQATLDVTVDDSVATRLGAVAIDGEVWLSNPVTGRFEPLPPGIDIDPSRFFDPRGGWQPLLEELRDVELIGIDDRGGQRYRVRGTAPAAQVADITVGLVTDQDVVLDVWVHPDTSLVTAVEFETDIDGARSTWVLDLGRYGEAFTIEPPDVEGE